MLGSTEQDTALLTKGRRGWVGGGVPSVGSRAEARENGDPLAGEERGDPVETLSSPARARAGQLTARGTAPRPARRRRRSRSPALPPPARSRSHPSRQSQTLHPRPSLGPAGACGTGSTDRSPRWRTRPRRPPALPPPSPPAPSRLRARTGHGKRASQWAAGEGLGRTAAAQVSTEIRQPRQAAPPGAARQPEYLLCGAAAGLELEGHVGARHRQIRGAPGTDAGNGEQLYECPMCSLTCTNIQILEEHVDLHLKEQSFLEECYSWVGGNIRDLELAQQLQTEEDKWQRSEEDKREREEFKKLQRQYGLDNSGGYKQQFLKDMEREVDKGRMQPFEYHKRKADMMECLAFGIDDGKTKTSGVIEALCRYYQNENRDVRRVWLSTGVDHFHSSLGDRGWGCGYRNFQMLLSSLLKNSMYNDCLRDTTVIPSIPKIQSMIEDAWREGFDPHGASHFNNKLHGSKAWIGACEIYSLLTNLRIKCQIIDFHKPTGPVDTHPRLFEWVLRYYSTDNEGSAKVVCTSKPPIYLQHQGHSRTVIGIEEKKNKTLCLLLFDPGCPSQEMQKLLKQNNDGTSLRLLRKFLGSLKEKQYQIVTVDGVLSLEEKAARCRASQVLTSEKIP